MTETNYEMAEWSPNIVYVNELILKMIAENINEVVLTEKQDLMNMLDNEKNFYNEEGVRELPAYGKVINRMKVVNGLDPVYYKEEKMGKFNVNTDGQFYKFETTIGVKDSYLKIVKHIS